MSEEKQKIDLSKYMLGLSIYSLESAAIIVVTGDITEPLYTTYINYAAVEEDYDRALRLVVDELRNLTNDGENKFAVMNVPVEPSYYGKTIISYHKDKLLDTLKNSDLFKEYFYPENIPTATNDRSMVTDNTNMLATVNNLLDYINHNIDLRCSEDEDGLSMEFDHKGATITDNSIFYDTIKFDDGRIYYMYYKPREGVINLPNCETFSIYARDYNMHNIIIFSITIIIDIVTITMRYGTNVDINANHYSMTAFISYMLKCTDLLDGYYKGVDVSDEHAAAYKEYIDTHIHNVKRAFDEYGYNLCDELGADYNKVAELIEHHDESKYGEEEFYGYCNYFYPNAEDERTDDEIKLQFHKAWLHHIHNNPHHPEYWNLVTGAKSSDESAWLDLIDMPPEYIVEMLCDWQSFSYIGRGDAYTYYYSNDKNRADKDSIMSAKTIQLVHKGLNIMHI